MFASNISRQHLGLSTFACVWPGVLTSDFGCLHRLDTQLRIVIIAADLDTAWFRPAKNAFCAERRHISCISMPHGQTQARSEGKRFACRRKHTYQLCKWRSKANWTIALLHVDSWFSTIVSPSLVSKSKANKGKDEVTMTCIFMYKFMYIRLLLLCSFL